jgi:hypothetical protein
MTRAGTAFIALAIGAGLGIAGAGEALAQGRIVVPIIVAPRSQSAGGAVSDTRIVVQPGASVAGSGRSFTPPSGAPSGGFSVPAVTQELRIISRPPTSVPPNVGGGTPTTRITVDQLPGSAGMSSVRPSRGFGSVPAFNRETHVTVEQDNGRGAPGTRQEIQILTNSTSGATSEIETPLIVLTE